VPDSAWFPFSLERCWKIWVPQVWAQLSMVFTSWQVVRFVMVVLRSWLYGVQDISVSFKKTC